MKLKSFCTKKENHQEDEKTTHRMREDICKWSDGHEINLQNTQTAHAALCQKNKQPNQKMAEYLNIHFSKEDRWPKSKWKNARHH